MTTVVKVFFFAARFLLNLPLIHGFAREP